MRAGACQRAQRRHPVRAAAARLSDLRSAWLHLGLGGETPPADLQPPTFFDNLDDSFFYASAHDPWEAHYSRVIENQLDVVHLPFIHRNSIGRGNRTLVDGPLVEWRSDKMLYTYVFNRVDDGTPPRKPSDIQIQEVRSVHLEFIMPNLWQNYISPAVRVVAAFVPVERDTPCCICAFTRSFCPCPCWGNWRRDWQCLSTCAWRTKTAAWWSPTSPNPAG
jgi:hypothetical protein